MDWSTLRHRLLGHVPGDVTPPLLGMAAIPTVVTEFCRAADRSEISHVELAAILDRDQGLVVEVLKVVNSAATGVRRKVNSSRAAIALLGIKRAKRLVLISGVQASSQKSKSPFGATTAFSFAALQRAIFARRLADRLGLDDELAFAGALLQDFTIPSLTAELPERYRTLVEELQQSGDSLSDRERSRAGWDHAFAGANMMLHWGLPDDLVCLTLLHHRLDQILKSRRLGTSEALPVALSALLPDPLDNRPERIAQLEEILSARFGIEVDAFRLWVCEDLNYAGMPVNEHLSWNAAALRQGADRPKSGSRSCRPIDQVATRTISNSCKN
ncbi:MAG: HDOD domain-containing protein [Planctomycetaceae bacterium]|nr:HDOD domain-containing protein [Planctomycetaceae bacterium]